MAQLLVDVEPMAWTRRIARGSPSASSRPACREKLLDGTASFRDSGKRGA